MEKEFVPYKLAIRLKQLGFDEVCFAGYRDSEWIGSDGPNSRYFHAQHFANHQFDDDQQDYCSAPTFSQSFRWFREKYAHIKFSFGQSYWKEEYTDFFDLTIRNKEINRTIGVGGFTSYEEAELSCLERLIEIVE